MNPKKLQYSSISINPGKANSNRNIIDNPKPINPKAFNLGNIISDEHNIKGNNIFLVFKGNILKTRGYFNHFDAVITNCLFFIVTPSI